MTRLPVIGLDGLVNTIFVGRARVFVVVDAKFDNVDLIRWVFGGIYDEFVDHSLD